jgi:hypothetical protein
MVGLNCQLQDLPALLSTFRFNQGFAIPGDHSREYSLAPFGCPDKMIYDQVYPMLIALIVEFHVDSIPIFYSLAYPKLKLLKKPTLSTALLYGVACGGFHSFNYLKA